MDKVLISSVSKKQIRNDAMENEIRTKFNNIGVKVMKLKQIGRSDTHFDACVADISSINIEKICGRKLGISNCKIMSYYP